MSTWCWQLYSFPIQLSFSCFLERRVMFVWNLDFLGVMKLWILCTSSVRASLCCHHPGWGRGGRVGGDVPWLHPSWWRVKTSCFRKGVNAPAPHPTPAETSLWGGGAGPDYCWGGGESPGSHVISVDTLDGAPCRGALLLPTPPSVSPPCHGERLRCRLSTRPLWWGWSWCLPSICGTSFELHNYCLKFAVLPGCLVPDLLLETAGFSFSFSMSIDASGYLLPQLLIQNIRSTKKTQGKHHHVLPWPPESAASLPFSSPLRVSQCLFYRWSPGFLALPGRRNEEKYIYSILPGIEVPNVYHLMK